MCSINDCNKKPLAKNLCSMHYWRLKTKGTTDPTPRSMPVEDRFWQKVDKQGEDECWNWTGQVSDGYGKFASHVGTLAHRYSWVLHNRELEEHETWENRFVIMHSCDNPRCVNPKHLSLGTSKMNANDRDDKGRHRFNPRFGEKNPRSKITFKQAEDIFLSTGAQKRIAEKYGVNQSVVSNIKNGKAWPQVYEKHGEQ